MNEAEVKAISIRLNWEFHSNFQLYYKLFSVLIVSIFNLKFKFNKYNSVCKQKSNAFNFVEVMSRYFPPLNVSKVYESLTNLFLPTHFARWFVYTRWLQSICIGKMKCETLSICRNRMANMSALYKQKSKKTRKNCLNWNRNEMLRGMCLCMNSEESWCELCCTWFCQKSSKAARIANMCNFLRSHKKPIKFSILETIMH